MELPIEPPFKSSKEKLAILIFGLVILSLFLVTNFMSNLRPALVAQIAENETPSQYLVNEVFNKVEPIDILLVGNCTSWWHIYTPQLKQSLERQLGRTLNVVNLGFNHFGSDVQHILIQEVLKRRKVHNLILMAPKKEDVGVFPHPNAIMWWIYPKDVGSQSLSLEGHLKVFGLSLFSSLGRLRAGSLPVVINPQQLAAEDRHLGFNKGRVIEVSVSEELLSTAHNYKFDAFPLKLIKKDVDKSLSSDWMSFYFQTAELVKSYQLGLIFVDSPHTSDFENNGETIAWGFEKAFPEATFLTTDWKMWQAKLPEAYQGQITAQQNLSFMGAMLFTESLSTNLKDLLKL